MIARIINIPACSLRLRLALCHVKNVITKFLNNFANRLVLLSVHPIEAKIFILLALLTINVAPYIC